MGRAPLSLYWPDPATTGAPVRQTPNSTLLNHFPSLNFTNEALHQLVHGDSVNNRMSERVPGDLGPPSLIGWVSEYQEQVRVLKQEDSEHEWTWNSLATARSHRSVFLVDLGEIPNWGALVDDLRWGLVYWVHNYLAEQAGRQFIGSLSGGVQFREDALANGEKEGYWRASLVAFTVAALRRSPGMQDIIHCDVVQRFSTWRTAVSGQRQWGLSRPIDEQVGTVSLVVTEPESIQVPRSLLAHGYPQVTAHESQRPAWIAVRRSPATSYPVLLF
jgi:hypothetical protein